MNILDKIIAHKRKEVAERKKLFPVKQLERSKYFESQSFSLREFLLRDDKSGIIAEFKRKSPSKGIINASVSVKDVTSGYVEAGASALSILTDAEFFGGNNDDLTLARQINSCPILRKDFTIDEYQIIEAKSIGADAILLIAAALTKPELESLQAFAESLELEILMEVHDEEELKVVNDCGGELIGVNNRNLKTFEVNIDLSKKLSESIPNSAVKISESGISSPETIIELRKFGYRGFLMGENFMKNEKPGYAAKEFVESLRRISK
ncbi:MAG: indole-3-glycerol phosphate synthase TrpC [Cyclobacteriaceae bacterium]